jgi:hypothetical protein
MLHDAEVHHALAVGTNAHVHASWRCFVFSCMEFVHGRLVTFALNKFKRVILPRVQSVFFGLLNFHLIIQTLDCENLLACLFETATLT